MREEHRQLFHMFFGFAIVLGALALGRETSLMLLLGGVAAGLLAIQFVLRGYRGPAVGHVLKKLERPNVLPGKGALMFLVGALFLLSYSRDYGFALGVLMIVAAGDAFSTFVGIRGTHALPWNGNKTWEGAIAFALSATVAAFPFLSGIPFLNLFPVIVYPLAAAAIETLPLPLDDNLTIPIGALALSALI
ncbi:MAG: hypothetical protein WC792_04135 [Candidatus Micrarchaeia archaeon]|jgi:dolichol kinase